MVQLIFTEPQKNMKMLKGIALGMLLAVACTPAWAEEAKAQKLSNQVQSSSINQVDNNESVNVLDSNFPATKIAAFSYSSVENLFCVALKLVFPSLILITI